MAEVSEQDKYVFMCVIAAFSFIGIVGGIGGMIIGFIVGLIFGAPIAVVISAIISAINKRR